MALPRWRISTLPPPPACRLPRQRPALRGPQSPTRSASILLAAPSLCGLLSPCPPLVQAQCPPHLPLLRLDSVSGKQAPSRIYTYSLQLTLFSYYPRLVFVNSIKSYQYRDKERYNMIASEGVSKTRHFHRSTGAQVKFITYILHNAGQRREEAEDLAVAGRSINNRGKSSHYRGVTKHRRSGRYHVFSPQAQTTFHLLTVLLSTRCCISICGLSCKDMMHASRCALYEQQAHIC